LFLSFDCTKERNQRKRGRKWSQLQHAAFSPLLGEMPRSGRGVLLPKKNHFSTILLFRIPPFNSPQRGEKFYFFSSFCSAKRNEQKKFQDKESDMDLSEQKMNTETLGKAKEMN